MDRYYDAVIMYPLRWHMEMFLVIDHSQSIKDGYTSNLYAILLQDKNLRLLLKHLYHIHSFCIQYILHQQHTYGIFSHKMCMLGTLLADRAFFLGTVTPAPETLNPVIVSQNISLSHTA